MVLGARDAALVLEDGRTFRGRAFGARRKAFGEVVFNTSMTGYQEVFSDPSYAGQLVCLTVPQVGNYGVNPADEQSTAPSCAGVIVRELSGSFTGHRSRGPLEAWLVERGIVGIEGVDTRALTKHLRERGAMRGGIFPWPIDLNHALREVRESPEIVGRDLTALVSGAERVLKPAGAAKGRVVLLDFGVKRGIVDALLARGLEVVVLPGSCSHSRVLSEDPDAVVFSNGPGDPRAVKAGIELARSLLGVRPILGICLGHQLLALALGARIYKLPFGHHGGNHPVLDLATRRVLITAQNHGFAVEEESLRSLGVESSHVSLYDSSVEGFVDQKRRVVAVQFHPEGCPGPHDADYVFDELLRVMGL